MGLLVALNSSAIHQPSKMWPDYGATLVFELVQSSRSECDSDLDQSDEFLVNPYYNEEPLYVSISPDAERSRSIRLSDLIDFSDKMR